MNEYVKKWIKVSENDNFKSTYQIVFGKAILEIINHYFTNERIEENDSNLISVPKELIANTMIHLYWKHSYEYRLQQSKTNAFILKLIDEIIEKFKDDYNGEYGGEGNESDYNYADIFFAATDNRRKFWNKRRKQIQDVITKTIIPAFNKLGEESLDLFVDYSNSDVVFKKQDFVALKENYLAIKYIYDYKWAQLLARYNDDFKLNKEMIELIDKRI